LKIIKEKTYFKVINNSEKPILIFFSSKKCIHCKSVEKILNELNNDQICIFKVIDDLYLINKFEIRSFPTVLTFDKDKLPSKRIIGPKTKDFFKNKIREILWEKKQLD